MAQKKFISIYEQLKNQILSDKQNVNNLNKINNLILYKKIFVMSLSISKVII